MATFALACIASIAASGTAILVLHFLSFFTPTARREREMEQELRLEKLRTKIDAARDERYERVKAMHRRQELEDHRLACEKMRESMLAEQAARFEQVDVPSSPRVMPEQNGDEVRG